MAGSTTVVHVTVNHGDAGSNPAPPASRNCEECERRGEIVLVDPRPDFLDQYGSPMPAWTWECSRRDQSMDISHWKRTSR